MQTRVRMAEDTAIAQGDAALTRPAWTSSKVQASFSSEKVHYTREEQPVRGSRCQRQAGSVRD